MKYWHERIMVHCTAGATGNFFALWPSTLWWHESDNGIYHTEGANIKHQEDDILQHRECDCAGLHLEGLSVFRDLSSLRVNAENLSGEKRNYANTECHKSTAYVQKYMHTFAQSGGS